LFLEIEKETKFKSSLAAIGLHKNIFWLSWVIKKYIHFFKKKKKIKKKNYLYNN